MPIFYTSSSKVSGENQVGNSCMFRLEAFVIRLSASISMHAFRETSMASKALLARYAWFMGILIAAMLEGVCSRYFAATELA